MTENPWPAETVELRDISDLKPYGANPRKHPKAQVQQIAKSIERWGWTIPVLVDESGTIIAGHGRLQAAKVLNLKRVPCMVAKGWTDEQKQAYVIADNQLTISGQWDEDLLKLELQQLVEADFPVDELGFEEGDLERMLRGDQVVEEDEVPEAPEEAETKPGQLWQLGRHRLLCGDSTKAEDVGRLLGGSKPGMMVTDPPYGVEYDADWRDNALNQFAPAATNKDVSNDDKSDWSEVWSIAPCDTFYVWHAARFATLVATSLESCGIGIRAQVIWAKGRFAISRGHYHWQHEPCWYAVREGKSSKWCGDRKQSTLWDIKSMHVMERAEERVSHPTQKPIECMARPIRNHEFQEIYDPFLGSGTTLIACEQLGRTCYGMELDPIYCDVIIQRWENLTGETAQLVK